MDGFAATLATFEDEPELEFDKDSPEIEGTYNVPLPPFN